MREIPNLLTIKHVLEEQYAGKMLSLFTLHHSKWTKETEEEFKTNLQGARLKSVSRLGKMLSLMFDNNQVLGLQFVFSGILKPTPYAGPRYTKTFELTFEDESGLIMVDRLGQARPTLNPPPLTRPDVLDDLTLEMLQSILRKHSHRAIKSILTNQNIIIGLGTRYCDEVLFHAQVHPLSFARRIPANKVELMFNAIRSLLTYDPSWVKAIPDGSLNPEGMLNLTLPLMFKLPGSGVSKIFVGDAETLVSEEQILYT